jgi:septum formation protein
MPLSHPLLLASQSPRREQILRMLGFDFEILPAHVDETPPPGLEAADIPEALARAKALEVSRQRPETLVLGSDTLVEIDGRILGKPADAAEAVSMLQWLNGRAHRVYTGVALARAGVVLESATERTEVTFALRPMAEIEAYVRGGEPMDKAGSYAIQGRGAFLVEKIDGCFFNVMGLPVQKTLRLLAPHEQAGTSTFP